MQQIEIEEYFKNWKDRNRNHIIQGVGELEIKILILNDILNRTTNRIYRDQNLSYSRFSLLEREEVSECVTRSK